MVFHQGFCEAPSDYHLHFTRAACRPPLCAPGHPDARNLAQVPRTLHDDRSLYFLSCVLGAWPCTEPNLGVLLGRAETERLATEYQQTMDRLSSKVTVLAATQSSPAVAVAPVKPAAGEPTTITITPAPTAPVTASPTPPCPPPAGNTPPPPAEGDKSSGEGSQPALHWEGITVAKKGPHYKLVIAVLTSRAGKAREKRPCAPKPEKLT